MTRLKTAGWGVAAIGFCLAVAVQSVLADPWQSPPTTAPSDAPRDIQFQRGKTDFEGGDTIIISSVSGPTDSILPGKTYQVEGTYILSSHDEARLVAGVTPLGAASSDSGPGKNQSIVIDKGMGKFSLTLTVPARGYPFLSLNDAASGVSFGDIYFGTTGSVLQVTADDSDDPTATATPDQSAPGITLDVNAAQYSSTPVTTLDISSGPVAGNFPFEVPFQNGARFFNPGDDIVIQEVRGTAATFQPGNTYVIKGIYSLASQGQAVLGTNVTGSVGHNTSFSPPQVKMIASGTGNFVLVLPMQYPGDPHVSFYPACGGPSFGSAYFGIGNSLLQNIPIDLSDSLQYSWTNNLNSTNSSGSPVPTQQPTATPPKASAPKGPASNTPSPGNGTIMKPG